MVKSSSAAVRRGRIFYTIKYCIFDGVVYNIRERTPPENARVLNQRTRYVEVALGVFSFYVT